MIDLQKGEKEEDMRGVIDKLEKKFYVSDKSKLLSQFLEHGPHCPKERGFPLRKKLMLNFK